MSEIGDKIQEKCLAFGDRIIKLNDYLLEQAASRKSEGRSQKEDTRRGRTLTSSVLPLTSRVPVHLQSVAALANQLLRSGRFSSTAEGKVNEYRSQDSNLFAHSRRVLRTLKHVMPSARQTLRAKALLL